MCGVAPTLQGLYEQARDHGLSHDQALDAVAAGRVTCWCGKTPGCSGGAQRLVGCPVFESDQGGGLRANQP